MAPLRIKLLEKVLLQENAAESEEIFYGFLNKELAYIVQKQEKDENQKLFNVNKSDQFNGEIAEILTKDPVIFKLLLKDRMDFEKISKDHQNE